MRTLDEATQDEQAGIWCAMIVVLDTGEHCPHHFGAGGCRTHLRLHSGVQRRVLRMNRLPESNRGNSLQL